MKLIIDIPDKAYNEYQEGVMSMENNCIIGNAVFDGKPYEEPTGDLISRSELRKVVSEKLIDLSTLQQEFPNKSLVDAIAYNVGIKDCLQEIINAPTGCFDDEMSREDNK